MTTDKILPNGSMMYLVDVFHGRCSSLVHKIGQRVKNSFSKCKCCLIHARVQKVFSEGVQI